MRDFLAFIGETAQLAERNPFSTFIVCRGSKAPCPAEKSIAMMDNLESVEGSVGHCSVCGQKTELVRLPGKPGRSCLGCSGDLATADLLITEIEATLAGRNTNALVSEFEEISSRLLQRAQSAELGM
jgi:hypothetical protein